MNDFALNHSDTPTPTHLHLSLNMKFSASGFPQLVKFLHAIN